jgi:hypothetical protein
MFDALNWQFSKLKIAVTCERVDRISLYVVLQFLWRCLRQLLRNDLSFTQQLQHISTLAKSSNHPGSVLCREEPSAQTCTSWPERLKKSVSDHAENEVPASSLESSGRVLRLHTYIRRGNVRLSLQNVNRSDVFPATNLINKLFVKMRTDQTCFLLQI